MAASAVLAVAAACAGPGAAPERLAPSLADMPRLFRGDMVELPLAELWVPEGYAPPTDGRVPLFVHFQGGSAIARENFARMTVEGVLIASTLSGRSSAFSRPYEDPAVFRELLAAAERALAERWGREVELAPITITFFSAGYGAVREVLKEREFFERIEMLVSADSIYASIVAPGVRAPRVEQMVDFARFAQAAARGEKTFVVAHTEIETPYASTRETADFLLAALGAERQAVAGEYTARGVPIASRAEVGRFFLYGFAGDDATAHMDLLYAVPELVGKHREQEARWEPPPVGQPARAGW